MKVEWADVANVVTAACAVIAIFIAAEQIRASNESAREVEAASAYRDYLSLAIEHPDLANGAPTDGSTDKYEWYVSYLLNSSEQIAASSAYDRQWEQTILDQLCLHRAYLESPQFVVQRAHYETGLQKLMEKLPTHCR